MKTALKSLGGDVRRGAAAVRERGQRRAQAIERELDEATARIANAAVAKQIEAEWQDLTLPGIAQERGATHPLTQVHEKAMDVMRRLGFTLAEGPEIETPYYNFDALNIPENHPARDMQDTFWLPNNHLLRSHTTTVQARVLEQHPPLPIKVVAAGRVYRNEAVDATHLAMFHQFEGIWVEEGLTFGDLKGTLLEIAKSIYGEDHEFRFKPKYYPYTEPSVGMDMQCTVCLAQRRRLPRLPRRGLDHDPRLGDDPSEGLHRVRLRPHEAERHRVRPRHHAHRRAGGGHHGAEAAVRTGPARPPHDSPRWPVKFLLEHLRTYTDLPDRPREARELLDDVGIEVKTVETIGARHRLQLRAARESRRSLLLRRHRARSERAHRRRAALPAGAASSTCVSARRRRAYASSRRCVSCTR